MIHPHLNKMPPINRIRCDLVDASVGAAVAVNHAGARRDGDLRRRGAP